jgi:hypothetical protein
MSSSSGLSKPKAGTPESSIRYMVARGYRFSDILNRVATKFVGISFNQTNRYVNKWSVAFGKPIPSLLPPKLSETIEAQLRKTGQASGIDRITVYTDRYSFKLDAWVEDSWYVDVPSNLSGKLRIEYAKQAVFERMVKEYDLDTAGASRLAETIQDIRVEI